MSSVIKLRGLPWSCTNDDIIKFLHGIEILNKSDETKDDTSNALPAIYMMTNAAGRPRGEAFVELGSDRDIEMAVLRNNDPMGQRYIEVFRSNQDQMEKHLNESKTNSCNWREPIVRLRGLPFNCTKEEIIAFFEGLNIAYDGVMMVIDFSGRFNGEAFVQFQNMNDANSALDRHKKKISNRYIEVFRSTNNEMTQYANNSSNDNNYQNDFGDDYNDDSFQNNNNSRQMGGNNGGRFNQNSGQRQFQRPTPYSRNATGGFRPQQRNGRNFDSMPMPLMAPAPLLQLNLSKYPSNGRRQPNSFNNNGNDEFYDDSNNYDDEGNNFDNFDDNNYEEDDFEANNNQFNNGNGNFNKRNNFDNQNNGFGIKMRGLPFSVTEKEIRDFFDPLKPLSVVVVKGKDRRPSGECECYFSTQDDVTEAMKYDKKFIGNRYIELFPLSGGNAKHHDNKATPPQVSLTSLMSRDYTNNGGVNNFESAYESNGFSAAPQPLIPPKQQAPQANPRSVQYPRMGSGGMNEYFFNGLAQQFVSAAYGGAQTQQSQRPINNNNKRATRF